MIASMAVQHIATIFFAIAVLHTFSVKLFQSIAHRYPEGSVGENLFHLLGEVEVVFGIWAGLFILVFFLIEGKDASYSYLENRSFTEPVFVFVIMVICSSKPVLRMSEAVIRLFGRFVPINKNLGFGKFQNSCRLDQLAS